MRAREINLPESLADVPTVIQGMLLKLRKDQGASLNAKLLAGIFTLPDFHGWTMTNEKMMRPSNGGWVLSTTPWGMWYKDAASSSMSSLGKNGHISTAAYYHVKDKPEDAWDIRRRESVEKGLANLDFFKANLSKKGRWEMQNFRATEFSNERQTGIKFEFDFYTMNSVYNITSPQGETYMVGGDYKNGAAVQTTFPMFFEWAKENTNFMDCVLSALKMEPHAKKEDPKSRYVPPHTASAEEKKVYALLTSMTDDIAAEQRKKYYDWNVASIERFTELRAAGDKEAIKRFAQNHSGLLGAVWDREAKKLSADWKAKLEKYVADIIAGMQNMFVRKNTRKLASILSAKGNMKEEKVLSIRATNQGTIDARMLFTFEDGSSFQTSQSTEWSHASDYWGRVTEFLRFPTRFHDVVLPNGEKMKGPSEEQMNTVFVGAPSGATMDY
jgi:hypothetical protein